MAKLMRTKGLLTISELLDVARLMNEPPLMVMDSLIVPSLELKIAYLTAYGHADDARLRTYRSMLANVKEATA